MKVRNFFIVIGILAVLGGCSLNQMDGAKNNGNSIGNNTTQNMVTPYATDEEISSIGSAGSDYLNPAVMRVFALTLLDVKCTQWNNAALSERPVIIYGLDAKPNTMNFVWSKTERKWGRSRLSPTRGTVRLSNSAFRMSWIIPLRKTIKGWLPTVIRKMPLMGP